MPALITVSNEVGELRYISRTKMLKMMRGSRKIPTWNADEIGVSSDALQKMGIAALSSPPDMGRDCQIFEGSVDDQAEKLAEVFMSLK
jgi:electron transfer flavoprotein beta subunit